MRCTKHHSFPDSEPPLLNSNLTSQSLALKGDEVAHLGDDTEVSDQEGHQMRSHSGTQGFER